jgi:predicted MFS family arabinose efflux permease
MNAVASSLWRNSDFMKLWTGQTISRFGSTVTRGILPLVALLFLGATPLQMGLLAAVESAPPIALALVAGAWIDRFRRRPIMIATDLARAALLLTIPFLAVLGRLRLEHLFVVGPLVGILTVFFDVAYQSFVPTLVSRSRVLEANSNLGISASLAEVTAPGIGGALVQIASAPLAVLVDALTFIVSAVLVWLIRTPEPAVQRDRPAGSAFRRDVLAGLSFIARQPILRAFAADTVTDSFFGNFFAGLYALYCIRDLGMTPALVGLATAAGGVGDLIGAIVAERVTRRLGVGRVLIGAIALGYPFSLLTPLAGGPLVVAMAMVVGAQLFGDGLRTVFQINELSVRQSLTSDALLGRVNGAIYLLANGVGPLGAIVGGALAEVIGARGALLVAVAGFGLGHLFVALSPARTVGEMPVQLPSTI